MRIVELTQQTKTNILNDLLKRSPNNYDSYADTVNEIVNTVRKEGDKALFDYTLRFDKTEITKDTLQVTQEEINEAFSLVSDELVEIMKERQPI